MLNSSSLANILAFRAAYDNFCHPHNFNHLKSEIFWFYKLTTIKMRKGAKYSSRSYSLPVIFFFNYYLLYIIFLKHELSYFRRSRRIKAKKMFLRNLFSKKNLNWCFFTLHQYERNRKTQLNGKFIFFGRRLRD